MARPIRHRDYVQEYLKFPPQPTKPMGLADALAMVRDPETWLPPTEPAELFAAWRSLLARIAEIDRAARVLRSEFQSPVASEHVMRQLLTLQGGEPARDGDLGAGLPLRPDFERVLRSRMQDEPNVFDLVPVEAFAVTSQPLELEALASRVVMLGRLEVQLDLRHSYASAAAGSLLNTQRPDEAAEAMARLAEVGEAKRATQRALAEARGAADTRARVEAETRARAAQARRDEAKAEAERARQRAADAEAEARQAERDAAIARAVRPAA